MDNKILIKNQNDKKQSDEDHLRKLAKKRVLNRIGLQIHLFVYLVINSLLFMIYFLTQSSYPWYLWPLTGWGMGFAFHLVAYFNKRGTSISWHFYSYIIVMSFLYFTNVFTSRNYLWFFWPASAWGVGLLIHLVVHLIKTPKKGEDPRRTWLDRKILKELEHLKINPEVSQGICPKCGCFNETGANYCLQCGKEFNI